MPEQIPLNDSTITESSTGGPRSYPEYVDHERDALNAVENLEHVANRYRLEAAAGVQHIPQARDAFETLSSKVILASREIQEAASGMQAAMANSFLPLEGRLARWKELQQQAKERLDNLHADGEALLKIAHAELRAGALPKISEGREAFARDEVQEILGATPASHQLQAMVDIARGADRDQAAVVIGPLGSALLHRISQPGRELERNAEVLTSAALSGSETHGTPEQKAYAKAFREALPAMQKFHTTQVGFTRFKLQQAESGH